MRVNALIEQNSQKNQLCCIKILKNINATA